MKDYIEERAIAIANYIIDQNATVRQTAKRFGISKSTVHMDVSKQKGLYKYIKKETGVSESPFFIFVQTITTDIYF